VSGDEYISYSQEIGWNITESAERTLALEGHSGSFNMKNMRISGEMRGEGTAKVYLVGSNGMRYLVLDEDAIAAEGLQSITAYVINVEEQMEELVDITAIEETNETADASTDEETAQEAEAEVERSITTVLEYATGTIWDADNDGVAYVEDGVVDLTVAQSVFNWQADESKLCTKWIISSLESGTDTTVCNGAADCCALAGVAPEEESWNEPLYIFHGKYSTTENNTVSSQVIFLNQSIGEETYLESTAGTTASLTVSFVERRVTSFEDICVETCTLPAGLTTTEYTLEFELGPDVILYIGNVTYSLENTTVESVADQVNATNATTTTNNASIEFVPEIKDSRGNRRGATVEFRDNRGRLQRQKAWAAKEARLAGITEDDSVTLTSGTYDVNINFTEPDNPVKRIEMNDVEISANLTDFINVDDVEETGEFSRYVEVYAIDPEAVNFTSAQVTVTAVGTKLHKCAEWDFESQTCTGSWVFLQSITPGMDYTFTLTPDDPGLAESNGTFFEDWESASIATNGWTSSGPGDDWYAHNWQPYAGTYIAYGEPNSGTEEILEVAVSTAGYENITFSFYAKTNGLDSGEYIAADWYNGTGWTNVLAETEDIADYTLYNYSLPSAADNNANLKIRFRCKSSSTNEICFVDNVQVDGTEGPANMSNPTIGSVTESSETVSEGDAVTITANVTDSDGVSSVWVELAGTNHTMTSGSGALENQTLNLSPDSEGSHESNTALYYAQAYDNNFDTSALLRWGNPKLVVATPAQSYLGDINNVTLHIETYSSVGQGFDYNVHWQDSSTEGTHHNYTGAARQTDQRSFDVTSERTWNWSDFADMEIHVELTTQNIYGYVREVWFEVQYEGVSDADLWQYSHNTTGMTGEVNYTIYANDTLSNEATPSTGSFTVSENVTINNIVMNSSEQPLNTTLEFIDESNTTVYNNTGLSHSLGLAKGRYKIKVRPLNHKVTEVRFKNFNSDDFNITQDINGLVDIDDPAANQGFNEIYALNPLLGSGASNDTMTVIATASSGSRILYKCADWNFTTQSCYGTWKAWQAITPGQQYTAVFLLGDPGIAEGNGTFFEGFESGNLSANNWTTSGAGVAWTVGDPESVPYAGSYNIRTENTGGESIVETDVDTTGYEDINFSFYAHTENMDGGEYVAADWYNGTGWTQLMSVQTIAAYTFYNYSLPSSADNNAGFKIRFRCSSDANNEDCEIDNVQVTGTSLANDTTPPASVTGLANQSSGSYWIYWNWTEPGDADYSQAIVYINGSNTANTSNNYYNATGLSSNTTYTITVHTKDTSGNVNDTDVNSTARTNESLFDDIPPSCVLESITPPNIEENSTGLFEAIVNCSDASGINLSRFVLTTTVYGLNSSGGENYWTIRPPANDKAASRPSVGVTEQILRADYSGEGHWHDILFADNFTYAASAEEHPKVNAINGSGWAALNYSWRVEPVAFRSFLYLDRASMEAEGKLTSQGAAYDHEFDIYTGRSLLVKIWDPESSKGAQNYSVAIFRNFNVQGTPADPLVAYYCNNSYDPTIGGSPAATSNCVYAGSLDETSINTIDYTSRNSSYSKQFYRITNGMMGTVKQHTYTTTQTKPTTSRNTA
jgi:hypothetical protein